MMIGSYRVGAVALGMLLATGCGQSDAPQAAATPSSQHADRAEAVSAPVPAASGTKACMIAGEMEIVGRRVRSRDCLQADGSVADATHREICEGLAQFTAELGGQAGEVSYIDACPMPVQGSCKGLFGQASMHAFYYEREADDLASLPESCRMGGGTWLP